MKWYQSFFSKFEPTQFLLRKPKKVILRAFLSKNGKNDIVEAIFLQNVKFNYHRKYALSPSFLSGEKVDSEVISGLIGRNPSNNP